MVKSLNFIQDVNSIQEFVSIIKSGHILTWLCPCQNVPISHCNFFRKSKKQPFWTILQFGDLNESNPEGITKASWYKAHWLYILSLSLATWSLFPCVSLPFYATMSPLGLSPLERPLSHLCSNSHHPQFNSWALWPGVWPPLISGWHDTIFHVLLWS